MVKDPFFVPTAADVMADDGMEDIAAVGAVRHAGTHDPLELVDAVGTTIAAAETIAVGACRGHSSLAALAPDDPPVDHLVDVAECANGTIERGAGDRKRLVRAPEQLGRDRLAVDLERELAVKGIAVCKTP